MGYSLKTPDFRKLTQKLRAFFQKDLKLKLIVLLGLVGMALILISQFTGQQDSAPTQPENPSNRAVFTAEEYALQLEEKLSGMVAKIDGVGQVHVMVTLENSGEYVYVQEEKRSLDKSTEPGREGAGDKINSKENIQQNYILVETGYGQKEPLLKTQLEPKVQGVVIICQGADNALVRQSLINVVTTSLNIPTTRVCVEKIAG